MSTVTRCCCLRPSGDGPGPSPIPPVYAATYVTTSPDQTVSFGMGVCGPNSAGDPPTMDWGDGEMEEFEPGVGRPSGSTTPNPTLRSHTYAEPGTYSTVYSGTFTSLGSSSAVQSALVSVDRWDPDTGTVNVNTAYYNATALISIATPPPGITDAISFLRGAVSFNSPLNDWDVSTIVFCNSMFQGCASFNQPLDSWDVSAMVNPSSMFFGCTVFNQPLNTWRLSTPSMSLANMFRQAAAFNQPLDQWTTGEVISMSGMFQDAASFDQDLSGWDVSHGPDHGDFATGANPEWTIDEQPQWPTPVETPATSSD